MRLTLFNGSPRGKAANSERLINWLLEGMPSDIDAEVRHLIRLHEHEAYIADLQTSEAAVIVFPLYTDSMPGIVMSFVERLAPYRGQMGHLRLGFVVHSGFPEACQSRAVESYLVWLCRELGADYAGTVIMGGSESMRHMSDSSLAGRQSLFAGLGASLVRDGHFDAELIRKAAGMERLPAAVALLFKVISRLSFFQSMWDKELKKNGAYHERGARPYETK